MRVELPDGRIIDDVPEGTTKAQLAEKLKANGMDVPKEWLGEQPTRRSPVKMLSSGKPAIGEDGRPMPDEGGSMLDKPFPRDPNYEYGTFLPFRKPKAGGPAELAVPGVVANAIDAFTAPRRAAMGKMENPEEEALNVGMLGVGPGVQSRVGKLNLAGKESVRRYSENLARNADPEIKTLRQARPEGYLTMPETKAGKALTSIGTKQITKQEITEHNQAVSNKVAKRAAGVPDRLPLTLDNIKDARYIIEQPYREVAAVSPTAEHALQEMKAARVEAKAWWNHYNRSGHPDSMEKARLLDSDAKFWEALIDNEAQKHGTPDLVKRLQEARVRSAQNRTVERFTNEATGDFNARGMGRLWRKTNGQGITGDLDTIGRFAAGPGQTVTREVSAQGPSGGQHGAAVESAMGALYGAHKGGATGAAIGLMAPLARIPARALVKSGFGQRDIGPVRPGLGLRLSDLSERAAPWALAMQPQLGLRAREEE